MSDISPDTITPTDESNSRQSEPAITETFPPAQASSSPFQKTQSTSNESYKIESEQIKNKKWMLPLIALIVAVVTLVPAGYFYYQNTQLEKQVQITDIDSYDECLIAEGSSVQSSDKTVCTTMAGIDFVKPIPESEAANDYPSAVPTRMAQIQQKDGFVMYSEPVLGYTFKYKTSEYLEGKDCSNGRYQIFNPKTVPPNSDEPCGSHGISDLGVSGNIKAISIDTQRSFCKQTEESSWRMKLSTESINGNDVSICKYSFIGERLYPGPDEFWEALLMNDESQVMIDLEDLEFTDLFYEILSTFEFGDAANEASSSTQSTTCVYENDDYQFSLTHPCFDTGGMIGLGTIQENFEQLITLHPDTLGGGTDEKFDGLSVYAKRFNNSQELTSSLQALIDEFIPEKNPDNNATNPVKQTFEQNEQTIVRIENLQFGLRLYALDLQNTNSLIVFFVSEKTAGSFIEEAEKIIFSASMK